MAREFLIFRIEVAPGGLRLGIDDHPDDELVERPFPRPWWPPFEPRTVFVPRSLREVMAAAVDVTPIHVMRGPPHQKTVPIFLHHPRGLSLLPWDWFLQDIVYWDGGPSPQLFQPVHLLRDTWHARPPAELPLRLLSIQSAIDDPFVDLIKADWYAQVRSHGLEVHHVTGLEAKSLRSIAPDVVIADAKSIGAILSQSAGIRDRDGGRPRLVILLLDERSAWLTSALDIPPGLALIALVEPRLELVTEILYGIIHDLPLHQALRVARTNAGDAGPFPWASHQIFADPASNDGLRLSQTAESIVTEAMRLSATAWPGDVQRRVERSVDLSERARTYLETQPSAPNLAALPQRAARFGFDFGRETWGLEPLVRLKMDVGLAQVEADHLLAFFREAAGEPTVLELLTVHQDRTVEIELFEWIDRRFHPKQPNYPLTAGARVRLRVLIGYPSPNSLFEERPPSIDPLLPDLEDKPGHDLHIVVYEKNFEILGERLKGIYLPRFGASDPVDFELLAPKEGPAELRVAVYRGNYLIQSFRVTATIAAEVTWQADRQVRADLEFSASERFTNLDDLGDRTVSFASNADPAGTHTLMLKQDEKAIAIQVPEEVMTQEVGGIRTLLEENTSRGEGKNKVPRFPASPAPGAAGPSDDYYRAVRQLARRGKRLHGWLKDNFGDVLGSAFDIIREEREVPIQIVRHTSNFVFPWAVLYDFPLPDEVPHETLPICFGRKLDGVAPKHARRRRPRGCPHNPELEVVCIHGFWGVRHHLEQLTAVQKRRDVSAKVEPLAKAAAVLLTRDSDRPSTHELRIALEKRLAQRFVVLDEEADWRDYFDDEKRPAVFVVVGHMVTNTKDDEPVGARIASAPKRREWWTPHSIREEADKPWSSQPLPVVFLMACESAATELDTVADFTQAFLGAGASAVIGTEAIVWSDLAARFAREVIQDLWDRKTLGEGVRTFYERLLMEGNPLPFLFTSYGPLDLRIET